MLSAANCVKALAILACVAFCASAVAGCKKRQNGPAYQVEDLAVGAAHACAVMRDDSLRCWGKNDRGQLADGTHDDRLLPVHIESPGHVSQIFAGADTTCVLLDEGARVRCWGGREGLAAAADHLHDVTELALGPTFACALLKSADVMCWLSSHGGPEPKRQENLPPILALAAGREHVCAIVREDGSVRCWGKNESGQLGDGSTTERTQPTSVPNLRGVIHIAAGDAHTCATLLDRTVSCWGKNDHGQVGDGTLVDRHEPTRVAGLESVRATAAGDAHTCARLYDGSVRCWGSNDAGQQNNGTHEQRNTPGMISGLFDVQQLGLGAGTVCVRLAGAGALVGPAKPAVRCWGKNDSGQAGDGSRSERPVPVTVRW